MFNFNEFTFLSIIFNLCHRFFHFIKVLVVLLKYSVSHFLENVMFQLIYIFFKITDFFIIFSHFIQFSTLHFLDNLIL